MENLVPVPEGESLKYFGWRQDQGCYMGSVYFEYLHPVLSSCTSQQVTAAVDGYFESWPAGATVLLNRTKNREGALLYYEYGEGTVILTSLYTDWGAVHSQASAEELKIFRDLVTFARNPKLSIPMFNPVETPNLSISLPISIANTSEETAAQVKLKVYSPNRDRVIFETRQSIHVLPENNTEVSISFSLPEISDNEYGIWHTDYELYTQEGDLLQLPTEAMSGRFALN